MVSMPRAVPTLDRLRGAGNDIVFGGARQRPDPRRRGQRRPVRQARRRRAHRRRRRQRPVRGGGDDLLVGRADGVRRRPPALLAIHAEWRLGTLRGPGGQPARPGHRRAPQRRLLPRPPPAPVPPSLPTARRTACSARGGATCSSPTWPTCCSTAAPRSGSTPWVMRSAEWERRFPERHGPTGRIRGRWGRGGSPCRARRPGSGRSAVATQGALTPAAHCNPYPGPARINATSLARSPAERAKIARARPSTERASPSNAECNRLLADSFSPSPEIDCTGPPPEWGSGGRRFKSSRPDFRGAGCHLADSRPFHFFEPDDTLKRRPRSSRASSPANPHRPSPEVPISPQVDPRS